MEAQISEATKAKLANLDVDHLYTAQAYSPPWDRRPRNYTYWVSDGLSAGGVSFDESAVGGPSINQPSFSPGVILWDAGAGGAGAGFISYYPTNPSCEIVAGASNLTIKYVASQDWPNGTVSNTIQLAIASLPDFQLDQGAFTNGTASLPGLDVVVSGNVQQSWEYVADIHGGGDQRVSYYILTYFIPEEIISEAELVVGFPKTTPPAYALYV